MTNSLHSPLTNLKIIIIVIIITVSYHILHYIIEKNVDFAILFS